DQTFHESLQIVPSSSFSPRPFSCIDLSLNEPESSGRLQVPWQAASGIWNFRYSPLFAALG
ncbi:hypothetical protein AB8Y43_15210, partial [Listeria monocytogenes]|uniref:hypothetical protein n=1 Tax=Listeria monocytogenes TaxID=1639 RepID=UPI00350E49B3